MIIALKIRKCSIIEILIILMSNGNITKEVLFLIQNKDLEKLFLEMMNIMKETSVEIG